MEALNPNCGGFWQDVEPGGYIYICTKCWQASQQTTTRVHLRLSKKHFHIPNTKGALQRWMNATRMQQELIVLCCTRHALLPGRVVHM